MKDNYEYEYISSRNNDKVKVFSKLSDAKYRCESRLFLAEGVKLSQEATDAGAAKYLLVSEEALSDVAVKNVLDKSGENVIKYILAAPAFSKVSTEAAPQGIIAVCTYLQRHSRASDASAAGLDGKRAIALDGIRDPGNLGTILRSSLAFGYDCVILGGCADLYNTKTVRSSMGAVFRMNAVIPDDFSEFLASLSGLGRRIIGAALTDTSLDFTKFEKEDSDIPVIGNEGHGISPKALSVCDAFVKIPMSPGAESLNAGVAASVIMWEYSKIRQTII